MCWLSWLSLLIPDSGLRFIIRWSWSCSNGDAASTHRCWQRQCRLNDEREEVESSELVVHSESAPLC